MKSAHSENSAFRSNHELSFLGLAELIDVSARMLDDIEVQMKWMNSMRREEKKSWTGI
jgi:hypothetical protein